MGTGRAPEPPRIAGPPTGPTAGLCTGVPGEAPVAATGVTSNTIDAPWSAATKV